MAVCLSMFFVAEKLIKVYWQALSHFGGHWPGRPQQVALPELLSPTPRKRLELFLFVYVSEAALSSASRSGTISIDCISEAMLN